ncbi:hypothetical protein Pla52n_70390 [Stieleria varia]|uniref:Uncharacterized protein n=1 Tax=Stieleria varia TaxID=2528005 RepID=A0A5C5ZI28_9BACT|nr:hypothetical protein Pla52n_70390 [Stieleria varia]
MVVERSTKSVAGGFANSRHMRRSTSSQPKDSANDSNNCGSRPTRRRPSMRTRGAASRVGCHLTMLQSSAGASSTSAGGGGRSCGQNSSSRIENDSAKASSSSLSLRGFMQVDSLRQNATNHPAATRDCPFKNAPLRRSGALDCSLPNPQKSNSNASLEPTSMPCAAQCCTTASISARIPDRSGGKPNSTARLR